MTEAKAIIIKASNESPNVDIVTQFEVLVKLLNRQDLLSFYISLQFLIQTGVLNFLRQDMVAELLGLSAPSYLKRRKELEQLGLLTIDETHNNKNYSLKGLNRINNFRRELKKFKDNYRVDKLQQFMEQLRTVITPDYLEEAEVFKFLPTAPEKGDDKKTPQRFPKAWYSMVLTKYQEYKGITLQGHEINHPERAIKLMFQSGRSTEDIIKFMKWLKDHESDEETPWVRSWTMWTVQKKLPEFLAGKLEDAKSNEPFGGMYEKITL